ncbi:MAG: Flp pilus assembly complex ATPase component TadA [Planctomycetota bacterium]|nr:MAG: Flp pilus assembly complex ATPase component TadA [Planctomycetota bacterium]
MFKNKSILFFLAAGLMWGFLFVPAVALAADPLAELPKPGGYTSWIRIVFILVTLFGWWSFCEWVDKDTQHLRRLNREMWNGIILGGGAVGFAIMLLLPWSTTGLFVAGFALWFVITVGVCCVYVVIRNGYVEANVRVFTPAHIKGWLLSLGKQKSKVLDAVERVRINSSKGEKVAVPTEPEQIKAYEAAQNLLFDALWRRATDVELLVGSSASELRYRIDGVLTLQDDLLSREESEGALNFIKNAASLDIEEKRRPQAGEVRCAISGVGGGMTEIEVQSSGTTKHEKLAMRIVGDENRLRVNDLGMPAKQVELFEKLINESKGLMVVSGPRRSGITTTLYAALRQHDAFMQNLLTLEIQPLMDMENITQHVYDSTKHEASYARQLQTVLRREPDVVMVSDCMDRETAHLAVTAGMIKKIYMGIQARDSFEALKKLVSLAGDMDTVADSLLAVCCQRLVRKLCIACRQAYRPDRQLLKKANIPVDKIEHFYRTPPEGLVDSKGNPVLCSNCQGSGYFGRTGVFEILYIDDDIRESIRKGQPVNAIRAQARKNGMHYLQEVGLQKVIEGTTSMNEVLRALRSNDGDTVKKAASLPKKEG